MAFAHGKILLLGEHAVVHGHPAIAAGLSVGVSATLCDGAAGIDCDAWDLHVDIGDETSVSRAFAALCAALECPPQRVTLDATVPAGAGMGSSAAMAVAIARTLLLDADAPLDPDRILAAARASEQVFHGNPSGLDHTVAMLGGVLRYVRGTPPAYAPIHVRTPLHLLIAQVSPGADTGRMVASVTAQRDRLGVLGERLHETIGALVDAAESALHAGDVARLGELMNVNHGLLHAIGVSTAPLDAACHAARRAGALGAKLTGAGGGGCMIALVDEASADEVRAALDPISLAVYAARVGPPTATPP